MIFVLGVMILNETNSIDSHTCRSQLITSIHRLSMCMFSGGEHLFMLFIYVLIAIELFHNEHTQNLLN